MNRKEKALLEYINIYYRKHNNPPSIRNIKEYFNIYNPTIVNLMIKSLIKEKKITNLERENLKIKLTQGYVKEHKFISQRLFHIEEKTREIPVINKLIDINQLLSSSNQNGKLAVPMELVNFRDRYCFYRIKNNDMKEAGIFKKDYVLVKLSNEIKNGEIGLFNTKKEEYVRTYFKKDNNSIWLQAENKNIDPEIFMDVELIGIVVAVFKKV